MSSKTARISLATPSIAVLTSRVTGIVAGSISSFCASHSAASSSASACASARAESLLCRRAHGAAVKQDGMAAVFCRADARRRIEALRQRLQHLDLGAAHGIRIAQRRGQDRREYQRMVCLHPSARISLGCVGDMVRAGVDELGNRSIAPGDADRCGAGALGHLHVVDRVADDDGVPASMPASEQHSVTIAGCGFDGQSSAVLETKNVFSKPWLAQIRSSPRRDFPVTAPRIASSRAESVGNQRRRCRETAVRGNAVSLRTPP